MTKHLLTLALAASVTSIALAQTQAKPEPPKAAAAMSKTLAMAQGTWVMTTSNGQDMTGGPEVTVVITGEKYVQTAAGNVEERGSFKLDESKKPMTIDLTITEGDSAGKSQVGVVEVTDTAMRGKFGMPGDTTRPTDFTPSDGFFTFTATLCGTEPFAAR